MSDNVVLKIEKKVSKRGRKPKSIGEENKNITIKTYHFNMCDEMISQIDYFATLHKHDDRKIFKEEWKTWIETEPVAKLIQSETDRLHKGGYNGNVIDKLYHSARYYYRKKTGTDAESEPEPKKRKEYTTMDAATLNKIEQHILSQVRENIVDIREQENKIITYCDISPANAYKNFLDTATGIAEDEAYLTKLKKTYKNRFFVIRKKCGTA